MIYCFCFYFFDVLVSLVLGNPAGAFFKILIPDINCQLRSLRHGADRTVQLVKKRFFQILLFLLFGFGGKYRLILNGWCRSNPLQASGISFSFFPVSHEFGDYFF
jgi:hypothetical protein